MQASWEVKRDTSNTNQFKGYVSYDFNGEDAGVFITVVFNTYKEARRACKAIARALRDC